MAAAAHRRVFAARGREVDAALRRRAADAPPPPCLALASGGFAVIAEIKRRSPAAGPLAAEIDVTARARAYERAGAAAISVLTEPEQFGGSLDDLRDVAAAVRLPAMRKDFVVDTYQVFEARAAGAAGVLVVLRLLDEGAVVEVVEAAREAGLFVLLEAFDATDLARAARVLPAPAGAPPRLIGVNARDLATLAVDPGRLAALARGGPGGAVRVAESGLADAAGARRVAALGYDAALVGEALMRSADPERLIGEMVRAGREERSRSCA
jgi:indole-3-glycerol phosphate synthase